MTAPNGVSYYRDIVGCTLTINSVTYNLFGITGIAIDRQNRVQYGYDNNSDRPVAAHVSKVDDNVNIATNDAYAYQTLMGAPNLPGILVFSGVPYSYSNVSNAAVAETVTVSQLFLEKKNGNYLGHADAAFNVGGKCLAKPDGSDPIQYAAMSSPPTGPTGI